ncbi:MAG: addiction module antidote protein [Cyanobium sp.]
MGQTEWTTFLTRGEEMAAYLEACIHESEGDAAFIAKALGDIARAKGMSQIAGETGVSRESLYKAPSSDRSPSFDTILKVISALGLQLSASVKEGVIVEDVAEVA